ncbi:MAG: hypothetical protein AAGE13_06385 [Pseudomonadota bacterium]
MPRLRPLSLLACVLPLALNAQTHGTASDHTPYAGLETRSIKSLSDADITELRRGGGWGLALPAELNGKPGPAHVLELKDDLGLSPSQVARVKEIFEEMQREAILAGDRLIAAEAALSAAFEGEVPEPDQLQALVRAAEEVRAELRYIHLSRHLATSPLLSPEQIAAYRVLRGYAVDPCASVPDGHDAARWKAHNGCL